MKQLQAQQLVSFAKAQRATNCQQGAEEEGSKSVDTALCNSTRCCGKQARSDPPPLELALLLFLNLLAASASDLSLSVLSEHPCLPLLVSQGAR